MPKYQMYFDTEAGWMNFNANIDEDEVLEIVLPDILHDLQENGYVLQGWRGGTGEVSVTWNAHELDQTRALPLQGVRPNEVLRVAIRVDEPLIQIRRERQMIDVIEREELRQGDEIIIGKTMLKFHLKKYQERLSKNTTIIQRLRHGRSFKQTVYFMSLVGGMAGLGSWFLLSLLAMVLPMGSYTDLINYSLLGGFIGGLTVGFNDHWLGDRVVGRFVFVGILVGVAAGVISGLIAWPIRDNLDEQHALLARALSWMIAGALIGFFVSLRWFVVSRTRVLYGLTGGLFGGLLGGIGYWLLIAKIGGPIAQALGLMFTGIGIACAVSLAPILLRQGILEFATSGDREVLRKYAQSHKQWDLQSGGKYVIGSLSARHSQTIFTPEVQIYIPDHLVSQKHAVLLSRRGKYYLEPHPSLAMARA